jgi:hypothetical protein
MPGFTLNLYTVEFEAESSVQPTETARKFVERILDDLHAASIVVKGTSGFYNYLPDVPASPCVAVIDLGGVPSHTPAPELFVQFRVRASTMDAARDKAAVIYNRYHTETDRAITGYRIISAVASGMPAPIGEDQNQRHLCGFNMVFRAHSTNQGDSTVGFGGKRDPNEA